MSQRNGDRARFNRERKKRILQRKRNRELRERLGMTAAATGGTPHSSSERLRKAS